MKRSAQLLAGIIVTFLSLSFGGGTVMNNSQSNTQIEYATFAGGCFWCMEPAFDATPGVHSVVSGYSGGTVENPTYEQVVTGTTGHAEVIHISFNPAVVSYSTLIELFWRQIDPTDAGGSFFDRGPQYRSEIFYHSDAQKSTATKSKQSLGETGRFSKPIATNITAFSKFWPAEDYHQEYYKTNSFRYKQYRKGSGRDTFIDKYWKTSKQKSEGPLSESELKKKLTPLQYTVTRENGTERPFTNEYWDNKDAGIYVDIISGEPLFSSGSKFKSGTGWPSFFEPLQPENIVEVRDNTHGMVRVEVRSKKGDNHLGHLFDDGPKPTGMRYCINSASLRFIPKGDLKNKGYSEYSKLF